jgi:aryl-alcohol dehydrogenase-like predicted oxidoreductase
MPLEYRSLGRTGLRVSSLGLGCVTFGREIDATASLAVLDHAVARGINLLDTAAVYGEGASEEMIGRWLTGQSSREGIIVATKVTGRLTPANIFDSIDGSLRRLGVEAIDLLQAHEWDSQTPVEQTLEAFDTLVRRGKVRHIGCSNWTAGQIGLSGSLAAERGWSRIESVQPRYSLAERAIETDLLPLCAARQIGVISYSPLGAGFLTGKYQPGGPIPPGTRFDIKPGHQRIYFTEHGFRVVDGLRNISSRTGKSMAQLALGWVVRRPGITSVLIGARNGGQVDQAFDALTSPWDDSVSAELDLLGAIAGTQPRKSI